MARLSWINKLLNWFRIPEQPTPTTPEFDYEQTPRNDNMESIMPTLEIPKAEEFIDNWLGMLQTIYENTMTYANGWRDKGLSSEDRQERYMCYTATPRLEATYRNTVSLLKQMRAEFGDEKTAQALSQDIELDYTLALVFMPPSEVQNQMAMTLEQVQGVFNRLLSRQNENV